MDNEDVGTGIAELIDVVLWIRNHQVYVERYGDAFFHRLNHHWAKSDIGYELTIHDITMDTISTRVLHSSHIITQHTKVRG